MGWYFCVLSAGDVVCRRENREMDVKKRRGSCFFVAHPALQGLRIAPHRRTSNTETHAVCKTPRCRLRGRAWNWHAWTSTVALRSAVCSKIANVLDREAKTCKRLVLICNVPEEDSKARAMGRLFLDPWHLPWMPFQTRGKDRKSCVQKQRLF